MALVALAVQHARQGVGELVERAGLDRLAQDQAPQPPGRAAPEPALDPGQRGRLGRPVEAGQADAEAIALDGAADPRPDDVGRAAQQVLPALAADVVVAAQEGRDDRGDGPGVVGEPLAGDHRRQLDHAHAALRRRVPALAQADGLEAGLGHGATIRPRPGRRIAPLG